MQLISLLNIIDFPTLIDQLALCTSGRQRASCLFSDSPISAFCRYGNEQRKIRSNNLKQALRNTTSLSPPQRPNLYHPRVYIQISASYSQNNTRLLGAMVSIQVPPVILRFGFESRRSRYNKSAQSYKYFELVNSFFPFSSSIWTSCCGKCSFTFKKLLFALLFAG